jgi:hypothetical protein
MMLIEMPIPVEVIFTPPRPPLRHSRYCIKWKFSESSRRPAIHTKITYPHSEFESVELITPYEYEKALSNSINKADEDMAYHHKEITNSKKYLRKFLILHHPFKKQFVTWWYMSKSNFGMEHRADPLKIIPKDVYKVAFVSQTRTWKDTFFRIEEATGRLNKELKLVPFKKPKISIKSLKQRPYQDLNRPSLEKLRHYKALEPNYFTSIRNNERNYVKEAVLVSNYYINDFSTDEFWNTIIDKFNMKFSDTHNEKMRRQQVFEKRRGMKKNAETFEANDIVKERYFDKQLKKYEDKINWKWLSQNPSLTPALIEKYEDKLNWNNLSKNPSLTPALIEKYEDKWDWYNLSENLSLTPALIEKYKYKLSWYALSSNPSLTPALIEKYKDKFSWYALSDNPALTPALIEKYIDKWDWEMLSRNPSFTPALIEKYEDKLDWEGLSINPSLTPALIEKYEDKLNWEMLSLNASLTPALIEKYEDKLVWQYLSMNPTLTPALIEKYIDKWDWQMLSQNPSLTPALIEKYKDKWHWEILSRNPALFGNLHDKKVTNHVIYGAEGEKIKFKNPLLYGAIIVTICALFKKS